MSLATALALLVTLSACPKRGSDPGAPSIDGVQVQTQGGSCDDFNFYLLDSGVTVEGQKSPGRAGAAGGAFEVEVSYGVTISRGVDAPDPVSEEICASAKVTVRFEPDVRIFVLSWNPPTSGISAACRAERDRFDAEVLAHEERHRSISIELLESYNTAWKDGRRFKACGDTEAIARAELDQAVKQAVDEEKRQLVQELKKRQQEFHDVAPPVSTLDCTKCL